MNRKELLSQGVPRHEGDAFSRRHPPMSTANRAKIFAPFAALSTYDAALKSCEKGHAAGPRPELSDDAAAALNTALQTLLEQLNRRPSGRISVKLTYFEPYDAVSGYVRNRRGDIISANQKKRTLTLIVQGAPCLIPFDHLLELDFL